jgi:MFS family permease
VDRHLLPADQRVTTLIFGKLGDMYGRQRIFQMSVVIFLIGSLLCGLAASMGMLTACRALQGIGGGGLNSLAQAITGDLVPALLGAPRQRVSLGGAFGAAIFGAILTGRLAAVAAFGTVFFWTVRFMALALVLALVMKEQPLSEEMIEVAAGNVEVAEY